MPGQEGSVHLRLSSKPEFTPVRPVCDIGSSEVSGWLAPKRGNRLLYSRASAMREGYTDERLGVDLDASIPGQLVGFHLVCN